MLDTAAWDQVGDRVSADDFYRHDHKLIFAATAGLIERQSQIAQLLQCAEVVGILQTVFDFTVAWALDRHTFGRPLASYQALKHRFADMKMWLEACRATTTAAVAAISARSPEAALSASIAFIASRRPPAIISF